MGFREDFIWGAATASFQIEGAGDERADSIWDVMCRQPGRIYGGHDGRVACDHVHRFREDVAIMRELGIRNYRFSISWPRVMPQGTGEVDEKGLAFYSELVDCLLENGIRPFVTLYHWDLPQALQLRGGWANPDIPKWFAEYTKVVARCFGDRVKDYLTLNEPQCFVGMGYHKGTSAPGMKNTPRETMMPIVHHVLRAHGEAVRVLRELVPGVRVGVAPCGDPRIPASDDPRDIEAARAAYFACEPDEYFCVSLFSDPMMLGAMGICCRAALSATWRPSISRSTTTRRTSTTGASAAAARTAVPSICRSPSAYRARRPAGPSIRRRCTGARASCMSATGRRSSSRRTA